MATQRHRYESKNDTDDLEQMSIKLSADLRKNIRALVSSLSAPLSLVCYIKCCTEVVSSRIFLCPSAFRRATLSSATTGAVWQTCWGVLLQSLRWRASYHVFTLSKRCGKAMNKHSGRQCTTNCRCLAQEASLFCVTALLRQRSARYGADSLVLSYKTLVLQICD
jgi:hypothetical protein